MRIFSAAVTLLLAFPVVSNAQSLDQVLAAARVHQTQQAFGKGVQIYGCQLQSGTPAWVFLGPDAILYQLAGNNPEQVATHSTGPVWQWSDGSGAFGKTLQTVASTHPDSIPQLLVQTQPFGTANGVLAGNRYVTRTDTVGGITPTTGCDSVHIGTTARVPYTATYTFFAAN